MAGWGAAAAGAATLFGGYLQNQDSSTAAETAFNRSMQARSTAYQTTVQDMKSAGLNPMLAYSQGSTGTPSSAMAQVQNVIGPAASTASQAYSDITGGQAKQVQADLAREQVANTAADTDVKAAQADNVRTDTQLKTVQGTAGVAGIRQVYANTALTVKQRDLVVQQIKNAIASNPNISADTLNKLIDLKLKEFDIPEGAARANAMKGGLGDVKPYLDTGGKMLHSAGSLIRSTR